MKEDDDTTVEHDYLHAKDYFSNYKFTNKERKSKLDFLQNISNESISDSSEAISSAKQQLLEVKNIYKEIDMDLKELSNQVYLEEKRLEENKEKINCLNGQEIALKEEYENYDALYQKLELSDRLNSEFDVIDNEIKKNFAMIDALKADMDPAHNENKMVEIENLKVLKNELAAKQKRLTIINTDSYIEDSYYWHQQYKDILEKIFGNIVFCTVDDKICIKLQQDEINHIEIFLKDKRIVEINISNNMTNEMKEELKKIKEYSLLINDIRQLLCFSIAKD